MYGVTGSGKTHTVTGTAAEPGLSPRSLDTLIRMRDDGLIDKITLAIYEIYNENIYDLLTEEEVGSKKTAKKDEERKKLKIRERDGQFYIEGLKTITLNDIDVFSFFFFLFSFSYYLSFLFSFLFSFSFS